MQKQAFGMKGKMFSERVKKKASGAGGPSLLVKSYEL